MPNPTPNTKPCSLCGIVKPLSDFRKQTGRKFNRESQCKECRNKANAIWRENNREHIRQRDREYMRENYPKIKETRHAKKQARRRIMQATAVNIGMPYTTEEEAFIMRHSGVLTDYQIAIHLGRTETAIQKRRTKLWNNQLKNASAAKK